MLADLKGYYAEMVSGLYKCPMCKGFSLWFITRPSGWLLGYVCGGCNYSLGRVPDFVVERFRG